MVDFGGMNVSELSQNTKDGLLDPLGIRSTPASSTNPLVTGADAQSNGRNYLLNSGFRFAQRQAPAVPTTYNRNGGSYPYWSYGADRWAMVNQNASLQYQRWDAAGTPESGLNSRYYGKFKKITNTGKIIVFQILEAKDSVELRGRTVRFCAKMRFSIAASMKVRLGVLYTTSSEDKPSSGVGFVSAFGANGTDPTWFGASLTAIAPTLPDGGSVVGNGMDCTLTSGWVRYSACFTIPANAVNVIPVIWSDAQLTAADELNISEAVLSAGKFIRSWESLPEQQELALVQRYYSKSFGVDVKPQQASGDLLTPFIAGPYLFGAEGRSSYCHFPVRMRDDVTLHVPAVVTYNPASANAKAYNLDNTVDAISTSHDDSLNGISFVIDPAFPTALTDAIIIHWSADADFDT